MIYPVKTTWWMRALVPGATWKMPSKEKILYLSFDDGPHPVITHQVLDLLARFQAKATFFCVGSNVKQFPETYQAILNQGHSVGNHTFHHLNGWQVKDEEYLENIAMASQCIESALFRPPYGRITAFQRQRLAEPRFQLKLVMWSVLSGDFDTGINAERCTQNVLLNAKSGDIIVFHDSEKAAPRLLETLPRVLQYFSEKGYRFERIEPEGL